MAVRFDRDTINIGGVPELTGADVLRADSLRPSYDP
jgi:hypothetical protein